MKAKSQSNVMGTIGTENYRVKDCPFHLPKENIGFFTQMQKAAAASEVTTYGNSYVKPGKFANSKPVSFT